MIDYRLKRYNAYSRDELISALQQYAKENNTEFISAQEFCQSFDISPTTIGRQFGTWTKFCSSAGLHSRYDRRADRTALLRNLDSVWQELGRQPRAKEMKQPLSPLSISRYQKVFGKTWYEICVEFLSWKTGLSPEEIAGQAKPHRSDEKDKRHKTKRNVPLSLRYDVLKRDDFKCVNCGRSPATEAGVQLHIDHILPWSQGGETEITNLQSLCSDCNLGKSNRAHNQNVECTGKLRVAFED